MTLLCDIQEAKNSQNSPTFSDASLVLGAKMNARITFVGKGIHLNSFKRKYFEKVCQFYFEKPHSHPDWVGIFLNKIPEKIKAFGWLAAESVKAFIRL